MWSSFPSWIDSRITSPSSTLKLQYFRQTYLRDGCFNYDQGSGTSDVSIVNEQVLQLGHIAKSGEQSSDVSFRCHRDCIQMQVFYVWTENLGYSQLCSCPTTALLSFSIDWNVYVSGLTFSNSRIDRCPTDLGSFFSHRIPWGMRGSSTSPNSRIDRCPTDLGSFSSIPLVMRGVYIIQFKTDNRGLAECIYETVYTHDGLLNMTHQ